jgi:pimeloyl-ACP methyl ester carboxylesterase
MRYIYLHGFASGPHSRKAQAFRAALGAAGARLEIPDLAQGDFAHLTISGQLDVIERTLQGDPARLIGSSMGGYLAALYAAAHPEADRVVLLAPAFRFAQRWNELAGPADMRNWRDTGWLEVFHYGDRASRRLHYGLFEDALLHDPAPGFTQPARIFHGTGDETVPVAYSREFAAAHPNAVLTELDSDHELLSVLDRITAAAVPFLTGSEYATGVPEDGA